MKIKRSILVLIPLAILSIIVALTSNIEKRIDNQEATIYTFDAQAVTPGSFAHYRKEWVLVLKTKKDNTGKIISILVSYNFGTELRQDKWRDIDSLVYAPRQNRTTWENVAMGHLVN